MILRKFDRQTQSNSRKNSPKSTLIEKSTSKKSIDLFIKGYIDDYMEIYGEDDLLIEFNSINTELKIYQKKMDQLDKQLIYHEDDDIEKCSFESCLSNEVLSVGIRPMKTKKSLFRRAVSIVESSKSSKKSIFEPD